MLYLNRNFWAYLKGYIYTVYMHHIFCKEYSVCIHKMLFIPQMREKDGYCYIPNKLIVPLSSLTELNYVLNEFLWKFRINEKKAVKNTYYVLKKKAS